MEILGVDVGGSGIKGALVDTASGELITKRRRMKTPEGFERDPVIKTVAKVVRKFDYEGPIGVGFPSVVIRGVVRTPPTSFQVPGWDDCNVAKEIKKATGLSATVINDGDAASLAEMRFGAGRGRDGVVMMFTLGTGIGTALFIDGKMVPNLELGHMYLRNKKKDTEYQTAERVRGEENLSWAEWGERLNTYFNYIERLFSPDLIIIGGGVSKKHKKFLKYIKVRAEVVPAAMHNEAGIVGAAMAALPE